MNSISNIEAERIEEQRLLDAERSQPDRNKLGQFATPNELARSIAAYAFRRMKRRKDNFRFLDPSIGTGSFYSAACSEFNGRIESGLGIEIDSRFVEVANRLWNCLGLTVEKGDFTKVRPPTSEDHRFNLVLTNPPYVRHHHVSAADKVRLRDLCISQLNISPSGLSGLYCYFLLLCDAWLSDNALSVWLIPSEFMDVNYGVTVKEYLLSQVTLEHIHRFCPSDVQFDDALVSSAVVVFRKQKPNKDHKVKISFGGTLEKPARTQLVNIGKLKNVRKWTSLPTIDGSVTVRSPDAITVGDIFDVKRGIATGSNQFFILPREEARGLGIPDEFLRPILPSPRYLKQEVIESNTDGYPNLTTQLVLVDCTIKEDAVQKNFPELWQYFELGKSQNIHQKYLTSRRRPWYSQERRETPSLLCTYMGRSKDKPFRFILNYSNAIATNVYLLLYPKPTVIAILRDRPEILETIFEELQTVTPDCFISEGRVYGGGLHKMEPNELRRVSLPTVGKLLDVKKQQKLF